MHTLLDWEPLGPPSGVGCPEAQGLPLGAPGYCPAPSLLSLADMPLAKGRAPGE